MLRSNRLLKARIATVRKKTVKNVVAEKPELMPAYGESQPPATKKASALPTLIHVDAMEGRHEEFCHLPGFYEAIYSSIEMKYRIELDEEKAKYVLGLFLDMQEQMGKEEMLDMLFDIRQYMEGELKLDKTDRAIIADKLEPMAMFFIHLTSCDLKDTYESKHRLVLD